MTMTVDSDIKEIQPFEIISPNRGQTIGEDLPPPYTNDSSDSDPECSQAPPSRSAGLVPSLLSTVPDTVKATNFLYLNRGNHPIVGTYVIDPRIKIPQFLLPALAADETESTRPNAFLHTSNGSIDVALLVIWEGDHNQKVNLSLESSNGYIVAKLHTSDTATRPPVKLCAKSSNGNVTIHLPRSFRGPVTMHTNGTARFSDAVTANFTTFTEANRTRCCFIGDFSDWTNQSAKWVGDEVELETLNGNIRLQYAEGGGETGGGGGDEGKGKKKGTFLGRLFGS